MLEEEVDLLTAEKRHNGLFKALDTVSTEAHIAEGHVLLIVHAVKCVSPSSFRCFSTCKMSTGIVVLHGEGPANKQIA